MVDNNDAIHIFEVKSVNDSLAFTFDSERYKEKIKELAKCYKQASIITNYIFYIPIKKDNIWEITRFNNGSEDTISLTSFIDFVKQKPL